MLLFLTDIITMCHQTTFTPTVEEDIFRVYTAQNDPTYNFCNVEVCKVSSVK